jgi:F0F1-type ATP synthase membrane subunit b/b'
MFGEHKQECFNRIQEVRAVQDAWWEMLTQHRSRSFEERQARIRANLEQNYERHRKAAAALESCRAHADELRDQIASAWSEDWRSRAEGWLAELEDKIRDIESSLERIEEWIREDESKLR